MLEGSSRRQHWHLPAGRLLSHQHAHVGSAMNQEVGDLTETLNTLCWLCAGAVLGLLSVLGVAGAIGAVLRWRESNARAKA